jgi:Domain of unknown function (DUF397)
VDVARANWRKSSYSSGNGGDCVESASSAAGVLVRDSKDPHGPVLALTPQGWQAFTGQIKAGAFNLA